VPFNTAVEALVNAATDDGWFYVNYNATVGAAVMDDPASTSNLTYYSVDGLHWAAGGHAVVADLVKTVTLPAIYSYLGVS
jgi:hypothetical protein